MLYKGIICITHIRQHQKRKKEQKNARQAYLKNKNVSENFRW